VEYLNMRRLGLVLFVSLLLVLPLHGSEAKTVAGPASTSPTVLIIGGLAGDDESGRLVENEVRYFEGIRQDHRNFKLIAIPRANPDTKPLQFPPSGASYDKNLTSHVLWRWIGIHAPDLVLLVGNEACSLSETLSGNAVAGIGRIPARCIEGVSSKEHMLQSLPKEIPVSEAHRQIELRTGRNSRLVAAQLAQVYGHDLDQLDFISSLALIGQLRLGRTAEVERLVRSYTDGGKSPQEKLSSDTLAGHLVFGELVERTGNPRYLELVRKAVDLGSGEKAIPLLTKAGKLTGNTRYFDTAVKQLTATRRGNAVSALRLMLALSDVPINQPQFSPLLHAFRDQMTALARSQDEDGLWHEAVDDAGTYSEFSATAIIAAAMLRGVNNGWLEWDDFEPLVDKAWQAILTRTSADGRILDSAAIADRDPRGGAMALMFALEMAGL
jgi:unsaturated rhamnogalacturonyl hydrolase